MIPTLSTRRQKELTFKVVLHHTEFEASLGHMRHCLHKRINTAHYDSYIIIEISQFLGIGGGVRGDWRASSSRCQVSVVRNEKVLEMQCEYH